MIAPARRYAPARAPLTRYLPPRRARSFGGNRQRKLFVKFRRYFCLNIAQLRRWKIYRTRELRRLLARPKCYARDYSKNSEHSRDCQRPSDGPEPGIILNVAQVQTRLCFFIQFGGKFALQRARQLASFFDKALRFGRFSHFPRDCRFFGLVEFAEREGG